MIRLTRAAFLALAPAAALVTLLLTASVRPSFALINESSSLPKGVYVRSVGGKTARGAIVVIEQPAAVRPYLDRLGVPSHVRLIKRVAAAGGRPGLFRRAQPSCAGPDSRGARS